MEADRLERAEMTEGAKLDPDGIVRTRLFYDVRVATYLFLAKQMLRSLCVQFGPKRTSPIP
jgi:hypothetical protein